MAMKNTLTKLVAALAFGASGYIQADSATFYSPYASFHYNFIQNGIPGTGLCIGGQICGPNDHLKIIYPSQYISYVQVNAHDSIGDKNKAILVLIADGVYVGEADVKKAGSTIMFPVFKYVSTLEFRSEHEDGYPNGEETVIMSVSTM